MLFVCCFGQVQKFKKLKLWYKCLEEYALGLRKAKEPVLYRASIEFKFLD